MRAFRLCRMVVLSLAVVCGLSVLSALPSYAADNLQSGPSVILPKDAVITGNYFAAGRDVIVSGTVTGDAYVAGGNIVIDGTINGDLIAAGGSITVHGTVTQNVRVAGGKIIVSGTIGRNLTVAGGTATIDESAKIAGGVVSGAGNLSVFAPIPGDIQMGVGNATIANTVGGNIQAGVGTLHLTSKATVAGNLSYWSNDQALIDQGATVSGGTQFHRVEQITRAKEKAQRSASAVWQNMKVGNLLSSLLVGILLAVLAPVFMQKVAVDTAAAPWKSVGVGLIIVLGGPLMVILFLVTVIGIPLALISLMGYILLIYLAKIATSVVIGRLVLGWVGKKTTIVWVFVTGFFVYALLQFIPVIAAFTEIVSLFLGTGALARQKYLLYMSLREKKSI